ncbi:MULTISPECIES: hypothetical protein [unclassified Pseudomonas]|uniref:hypothetical protein n=1 Tax=unclassified Pseudomonas TaxID=196821 RepID=UPI00128ECBE7|nr:hypothetical protein [Pseudomonas sp. MN1F]MQG92259.1 hypothetical protein [Pseudomonas sp. MN1F]
MKKLVPDPPPTSIPQPEIPGFSLINPPSTEQCEALVHALTLTVQQTYSVLLDSDPGPQRDAMAINIRLLSRMVSALADHSDLPI